jgi:hypothetical protein
MKKTLLASIVTLGLGFAGMELVGCTSSQVQTIETDLGKALQDAATALATLANDPTAFTQAEAALAKVAVLAPQTGVIHQAIVAAESALTAVQNHQNSVLVAQVALQQVASLLEAAGSVPTGTAASVAPGAVAPVSSTVGTKKPKAK